jgi:hypothetical protein
MIGHRLPLRHRQEEAAAASAPATSDRLSATLEPMATLSRHPAPRLGALVIALLGLWLLVAPASAAAESFDAEGDPQFRVEWATGRGRVGNSLEGYVYNNDTHRVGLVQLRVEVLDDGGHVIGSGRGWVYGDIPAGARAPFVLRPPTRGADYRVTVQSYSRISRDSP